VNRWSSATEKKLGVRWVRETGPDLRTQVRRQLEESFVALLVFGLGFLGIGLAAHSWGLAATYFVAGMVGWAIGFQDGRRSR